MHPWLEMRILIVNAFHASAQGDNQAQEFENAVKASYARVYSADTTKHDYITVRLGDLWEYIYLAGTEFTDVESQAKFDTLDAVFIDGSSTLMPWDEAAWPLVILVKLCMVHCKFTLAAGPGNLIAAYVCATGGRKMHVVHCGQLDAGEELQPAESEWDNVEDVLIDQATGDYYSYNWKTCTWVPQGNSGIYHYRAARRSRSVRSSYENNSPRMAGPRAVHRNFIDHRCNDDPRRQPLGAPRGQAIVRIRPNGGQNWRGFTGFEQNDFNVELASNWCLHETANRSNHHKYLVVAENESGPLVYQFDNLWGLGFHVTARFIASVMISRNFAQNMTEMVETERGGSTSARQQNLVVQFDHGNILVGHGSNLAPPHADVVTSMNHALERNTTSGYATARSARPVRCRHGIIHEDKILKPPVDNLWKYLWEFIEANGMEETLNRFVQHDKLKDGHVKIPELRCIIVETIGKSVPKERIQDMIKEAYEIIEDMNDGEADNGELVRGDGRVSGRNALGGPRRSVKDIVDAARQKPVSEMTLDYALFLDSLAMRFAYDANLRAEEEAKNRGVEGRMAGAAAENGSRRSQRSPRSQNTSRSRPGSRSSRLEILARRLNVTLPIADADPSDYGSQSQVQDIVAESVHSARSAPDNRGAVDSKEGSKADSKEGKKPKLPQLDLSSVHDHREQEPGPAFNMNNTDGSGAPKPSDLHEITKEEIMNGCGIKFSGGVPYAAPRAEKGVVRLKTTKPPYSTYRKYVQMRTDRDGPSPRTFKNGRDLKEFVPVVDDRAPYMSSEERRHRESVQAKNKWMDRSGFKASFGKASHGPLPDDFGVRATGPYFTDPREPYKKKDQKEKWATPGIDMYLAGVGSKIGVDGPAVDRTVRTARGSSARRAESARSRGRISAR